MTHKFLMPATLCSAALLTACTHSTVDAIYAPATDFSNYRVYRWYGEVAGDQRATERADGSSPEQALRPTIDAQLQSRGFILQDNNLQDNDPVDFAVNYDIVVMDRQDVRSANPYGGGTPGASGSYAELGATSTQVIDYQRSRLVIDFIDPAKQALSWRGEATGRISGDTSREKQYKNTRELIGEILDQFPPDTAKGS